MIYIDNTHYLFHIGWIIFAFIPWMGMIALGLFAFKKNFLQSFSDTMRNYQAVGDMEFYRNEYINAKIENKDLREKYINIYDSLPGDQDSKTILCKLRLHNSIHKDLDHVDHLLHNYSKQFIKNKPASTGTK